MALKDRNIFHITHVDNLAGIIAAGGLWSDEQRIQRDIESINIGLKHIKCRRLRRSVDTEHGGFLGQYVPFNFCPRSVMLCSIHKSHDDYAGGQESIVHLVSRISTATTLGRPWAFTDRHAELAHAQHYDSLEDLKEVPWSVMPKTYWADVKEERQAEFLVYEYFPWTAVEEIVAHNHATVTRAEEIIRVSDHRPSLNVRTEWYY